MYKLTEYSLILHLLLFFRFFWARTEEIYNSVFKPLCHLKHKSYSVKFRGWYPRLIIRLYSILTTIGGRSIRVAGSTSFSLCCIAFHPQCKPIIVGIITTATTFFEKNVFTLLLFIFWTLITLRWWIKNFDELESCEMWWWNFVFKNKYYNFFGNNFLIF